MSGCSRSTSGIHGCARSPSRSCPDNGTPLTGAKFGLTHPGAPQPVQRTIGAGNAVPRSDLPVAAGASALGSYTLALDPASLARKDDVADVIVVMDYSYTPAQ